jgi:hypothetical protein
MADFLAWTGALASQFDAVDASIEFYRPARSPDVDPYEWIETSYFGFSIPESGINAEIYYYCHPHLRVVSGGVVIQRGFPRAPARADYCDWRTFMPMPDDITNCTYTNGVTVRMTEPQRVWEISFEDAAAETSLSLRLEAIAPPIARANGGHICQPMRTSGFLRLRGENYEIAGFTTRDRSWGDPRSERTQKTEPVSWIVPIFNEQLAFHVMAVGESDEGDQQSHSNLLWGYIWEGERLLALKSCRKSTTKDPDDIYRPIGLDVEIVDQLDRTHILRGVAFSGVEMSPWLNMLLFLYGMRWEYNGLVGYGDLQEATFPQHRTR